MSLFRHDHEIGGENTFSFRSKCNICHLFHFNFAGVVNSSSFISLMLCIQNFVHLLITGWCSSSPSLNPWESFDHDQLQWSRWNLNFLFSSSWRRIIRHEQMKSVQLVFLSAVSQFVLVALSEVWPQQSLCYSNQETLWGRGAQK